MALVVGDSKGCKQFRVFLLEFVLFQAEGVVFVEGLSEHHVNIGYVFERDRVD